MVVPEALQKVAAAAAVVAVSESIAGRGVALTLMRLLG